MIIFLMRHGDAEQQGSSDATRELTRKGVTDNKLAFDKLKARSPMIEKAITSPYQRARQTTTGLRTIDPTLRFEVSENLLPDGDVYNFLDSLETMQAMQLFIVSHNPMMSNLLALLVDGTLDSQRHMGTSEIACISMDVIGPGCGELLYTITP